MLANEVQDRAVENLGLLPICRVPASGTTSDSESLIRAAKSAITVGGA